MRMKDDAMKEKLSVFELNDKIIMRDAMKSRGYTQKMMGDAMGTSFQNVGNLLGNNPTTVSLKKFVQLLNILGYDVVVKDRNGKSGNNWVVKFNETTDSNK